MQNKNKNDLNKELDVELDITSNDCQKDNDCYHDNSNELSNNSNTTNVNDTEKKEYSGEYIKTQLQKIQNQVSQILKHIDGDVVPFEKTEKPSDYIEGSALKQIESDDEQIIEGVFTGEEMVGPDGKRYSVPSNYASKSKLVEGDILKLIIKRNGTFVYKQIGPIERERLVGSLVKNDETGQYHVIVDGKKWKVLKASVTFFKGDVGDEAIILVPRDNKSEWATIENIVRINN